MLKMIILWILPVCDDARSSKQFVNQSGNSLTTAHYLFYPFLCEQDRNEVHENNKSGISSIVSDPGTQRFDPICQACQNRLQKDWFNQSFAKKAFRRTYLAWGHRTLSAYKYVDVWLHIDKDGCSWMKQSLCISHLIQYCTNSNNLLFPLQSCKFQLNCEQMILSWPDQCGNSFNNLCKL